MKTRSAVDLKNVDIKELLLGESEPPSVELTPVPIKEKEYLPAPPPHRTSRSQRRTQRRANAEKRIHDLGNQPSNHLHNQQHTPSYELQEAYSIIKSQSELIVEQRALINDLREELQYLKASTLSGGLLPLRLLLLDTESFTFDIDSSNSVLLPLQIAWGVYEWDEGRTELMELAQRTVYVSELMCVSKYRNAVKDLSEACFQRHEERMQSTEYPLMTAFQVLEALQSDIAAFNVATIVGYNLSWDFEALGGLVKQFFAGMKPYGCPVLDSFDWRCDNPFNPMGLRFLDLMHEVVKKYGPDLVAQGIKDGSVHRAEESNRILLRRNNRYAKSIYSAEYVLNHFFGVRQNHLADDDVRYEALLLEKCLCDFGAEDLEYNIMYPQRSCYQRMLHLAHEMFIDPINLDDYEVSNDDDDDTDTDRIAINLLCTLSQTSATTLDDGKENECLFYHSSDDDDEFNIEASTSDR